MSPTERKGSPHRIAVLVGAPLVLSVLGLTVVPAVVSGFPQRTVVLGDDLCWPTAYSPARTATLVFDLTKPLDGVSPSGVFRTIAGGLKKNAKIRVFSVTDSPEAPLVLLDRFCKPYDNAELFVAQAKDQTGPTRDCSELPAQIGRALRESAASYCRRRGNVERRLDGLAHGNRVRGDGVGSAHLAEALDLLRNDEEVQTDHHVLFVYSDMLQHSDWYSHLETEWEDWRDPGGSGLPWSTTKLRNPIRREYSGEIEVYYIPRIGLTDSTGPRARHQTFWQEFLAGADVRYRDQSPMAGYRERGRIGRDQIAVTSVPGQAEGTPHVGPEM